MGLLDRITGLLAGSELSVSVALDPQVVRPGETVQASVELAGADRNRRIERIDLVVDVYDEDADDTETVVEQEVTGGFTLGAGERRQAATAFDLPHDAGPRSELPAMVVTTVETDEGSVTEMTQLRYHRD